MRIIAGRWKGLRLASVGKGDAGAHLRPTTDRTRESLFNILSNHVDFAGLQVLDLFAGTGALGLEALSRGAAGLTLVENGRVAQRIIQDNLRLTQAENCELIRRDATRLTDGSPHDLVFLDPPYGKGLGERAIAAALATGWIAPGAVTVWEEGVDPMIPDGFEVLTQRRYGDTVLTLLEAP